MNRWTLEEISLMVNLPIPEVASLYKQYVGANLPDSLLVVGQEEVVQQLMDAIKTDIHVILHGSPGIGKTASAVLAVNKSGRIARKIDCSNKRTAVLLSEELFGGYATPSDNVYILDEIDNFHWQSHAYFKGILEDSKVSMIMTCNDIKKVGKSVVDYVKKNGLIIQMEPPSIGDLERLISRKFPTFTGNAGKIYNQDFRIVMRRLIYGHDEPSQDEEFELNTEKVAGAILGTKDRTKRLERIEADKDPLLWLIPWLDYNSPRFFDTIQKLDDFLDKTSIIDSWLIRTSQDYTEKMFAALPCQGRRAMVEFPAAIFNAEKAVKKDEPEEEVKEAAAPKIVEVDSSFDPLSF